MGALRWLLEPVGRRRRRRRLPLRLLPDSARLHLVLRVEKSRAVPQKVWVESVSVTEDLSTTIHTCSHSHMDHGTWRGQRHTGS